MRHSSYFRIIIFIACFLFVTVSFANEITIFDSDGVPTAYIAEDSDSTIYLWSGEPVGYLDSDSIYGFNGKHLGWLNRGILYDHDGYIVGFLKGSIAMPTVVESIKGLKELKPLKSLKELKPLRPLFGLQKSTGLKYFLLNGK